MNGIADYEFARSLGRGNNGELFVAAPPPRLGLDVEWVVVKVLTGPIFDDVLRRATRELRLLRPCIRPISYGSSMPDNKASSSSMSPSTCRWARSKNRKRR